MTVFLPAAYKCQYCFYSRADFSVFRPAGATSCTDQGEIWQGEAKIGVMETTWISPGRRERGRERIYLPRNEVRRSWSFFVDCMPALCKHLVYIYTSLHNCTFKMRNPQDIELENNVRRRFLLQERRFWFWTRGLCPGGLRPPILKFSFQVGDVWLWVLCGLATEREILTWGLCPVT